MPGTVLGIERALLNIEKRHKSCVSEVYSLEQKIDIKWIQGMGRKRERNKNTEVNNR